MDRGRGGSRLRCLSGRVKFFFFVLQIQFKGARRRGSSRSCRANVAAQGHMSQPCDIKEEQERGTGEGGGREGGSRNPSTTDMHTNTELSCKVGGRGGLAFHSRYLS